MSGQNSAGAILLTRPLSGALLVLTCALTGGTVVLIFALDPRTGVGLFALVLTLFLLLIRLQTVIYAIVAASVVLVDGWLMTRSVEDVPFRLGLGRLYLMEIPILLLFLGYLYRRRSAKKERTSERIFVSTPLDLPLKAWLVAFPVFAMYGLLLGHPLQDAVGYNEWRCLFIAILFYFLVTSLFREYTDLRKLWACFFLLTTAKAFYSLVLAITRIDPPLPLVFGQGPVGEGPENVVYLFAALPALAILLFHLEKEFKCRAVLLFGALTMIADIALSEKREPQLAVFIGLAVLVWHLPRREKIFWGLRIACLALLIGFSGFLTNLGSSNSGIGASLSRYTELMEFVQTPAETSAENTFGFHVFDIIDGWEKVKERPILGQGFGGQTERNLTLLPMAWGGEIGTGIIHNQYLTFWLKMGIAGPVLFLWLVGRFLYLCHRSVRGAPETYGNAVALGFCAAMWAELAMEFWTTGWIANTKTPIIVFLALAIAVGFLDDRDASVAQGSAMNLAARRHAAP
jgi:hypothetical protein